MPGRVHSVAVVPGIAAAALALAMLATAAAAQSDAPPDAVAPGAVAPGDLPPLPASLDGVPDPVLAMHVSTTFCEDPAGPPLAGHAALLAELGPTAVLVGIPCSGDAARAAYRLYVLETGEIGGVHAQVFALPSKSLGWAGTDVLWSPSVDADGRLTGVLYDPGEGRCASRGHWRWTGYALAMERAEIDDGCGGGGWRRVFP